MGVVNKAAHLTGREQAHEGETPVQYPALLDTFLLPPTTLR